MPESRRRKKDDYVPVAVSRTPVKLESSRWILPAMVFFLIFGLLWVVAYYIQTGSPDGVVLPIMKSLSALQNVGLGFGFMAIGFFFSTKWR